MPDLGFVGPRRSGKTFAVMYNGLLDAMKGHRVYSNFPIDHPNVELISPYGLVRLLEEGRSEVPVTICLQEVYGWMDSYVSMSTVNRFESYFVFQAAKFNYSIYWDSQRMMKVDSNLREMTEKIFLAEKRSWGFKYWELNPEVRNRVVKTGRSKSIPFGVACRFWDRYDTFKGVLPLGYGNMVLSMEMLEPSLMNETVDRQVKLLEKGWSGCVNKVAVEDRLLMLGEGVLLARFVANRLKDRLNKKGG